MGYLLINIFVMWALTLPLVNLDDITERENITYESEKTCFDTK